MATKFELTAETKMVRGKIPYHIKAARPFGGVKAGDLDGWVSGKPWAFDNSWLSGYPWISGDPTVFGDTLVSERVWISDGILVFNNTKTFN